MTELVPINSDLDLAARIIIGDHPHISEAALIGGLRTNGFLADPAEAAELIGRYSPAVADEAPHPEITRVLHAMTDRLHESLCNCRKYPAECASREDYRRDALVHTFGHAEEALEEALKQGWTPPAWEA